MRNRKAVIWALWIWTLLWIAIAAFGQYALMPPTSQDAYSAVGQPWLEDTNPHPVIRFTTERLTWVLSKAPGMSTQQLWATFTIPASWFFSQGLSNWVTNLVVSITNHAAEFFCVRAGNTNGYWSPLPR